MTMCSIAFLDTARADADRLITALATAGDHADAVRHSRPLRRRQSLAARVLLRAVLAREDPPGPGSSWRLLRSPQGHPGAAVAGTARRVVSLAHSGTIVACATASDGAIGIDVERMDPERPLLALARAAFGPAETAEVRSGGIAAFYRIWTLREALAKASGDGFELLVNGKDLVAGLATAGRRRIGEREWDLACWTLAEGYAMGFARQASDGAPILPPADYRVWLADSSAGKTSPAQ
jgi:phosphopantetheinyl transferase